MKYMLAFILLFFSLNTADAADAASAYYVPPNQFNASMQVMNLGLANIIGIFSNATGSFSYNEEGKSLSNLRAAVDATSLTTGNADNQGDLALLLGTQQYPEIRFTALDSVAFTDNKASIKGSLTIHGVSKPVTMDATMNNSVGASEHGNQITRANEMIGLSLHGGFKRSDFGMGDDPNVPGQFGDTITLQLEMQAMKQ